MSLNPLLTNREIDGRSRDDDYVVHATLVTGVCVHHQENLTKNLVIYRSTSVLLYVIVVILSFDLGCQC